MKRTEQFLGLYREYESLMRDRGLDCKEFEDTADDLLSNRLRMCRQFRNYLSHNNDPGFLEISDDQMKFLQERVDSLKMEDDALKKHLKTVNAGTCSEKDKCGDVLAKMVKLKCTEMVAVLSTGYGLVSIYDVSKALLDSKATKIGAVKMTKKFKFAEPLTVMSKVPKTTIICTDDGTSDGKLIGVCYNS